MKFSTATIFALANGIAAMPWASKNSGSKTVSHGGDITLHIKVSQDSMQNDATQPSLYDICLMVCWPEAGQCATGWYSKNLGPDDDPCWTCCRSPEAHLQL